MDDTVASMNQTMQVVMQNNLALLDFKGLIGRRTFTKNVYFITFFTVCFYIIWSSLMINGSTQAVQSHVYVMSNLHCVLMVPLLLLRRKAVHKYEKLGFIVIFVGTLAMLLDQWTLRADQLIIVTGNKFPKHRANY